MKRFVIVGTAAFLVMSSSCTKLNEKLNSDFPANEALNGVINVSDLLQAAYNSFRGPFQDQTGVFCLQDMSTDQCLGPTRGGDWDDNGVWRVLHQQNWDPENQRIRDNFNNLAQIVFNCTNILQFNASDGQKAEALMLRAYAMFYILDLYDKVPFREPGEDLRKPAQVLSALEALDKIIADLNTAMPNLGDGPVYKANKWAAKALLMKCYLNKGVYANRANPTFAAADMNQVISLGTEIVGSGRFALENVYWNAFSPKNAETSTELIFANRNLPTEAGNVRWTWHASPHYNQKPSGWNGFATLATFYNSFDATDQRRGDSARTADGVAVGQVTDRTGLRVGLLRGQQFGAGGELLKDRSGNDLIFSDNVDNIVTGNVELPGIRVVKYIPDMKPDFSDDKDPSENDYVLLRYADVLLMWAEAKFRSGDVPTALATVNTLRAKRGASNLAALTEDELLAERGREFYWESWRRNDLIRFKKFLSPFGPTKPNARDPKYLVYPIPNTALAVNPNLQQNPGY